MSNPNEEYACPHCGKPLLDSGQYCPCIEDYIEPAKEGCNSQIHRDEVMEGFADDNAKLRLKVVSLESRLEIAIKEGGVVSKENAELRAMQYLSPSEICGKYQVQACHICEHMGRGDNTSPTKIKLTTVKKYIKAKKLQEANTDPHKHSNMIDDEVDAYDAMLAALSDTPPDTEPKEPTP